MTIRPPAGFPLPELVLVSNRVLIEEAEALRAAMEEFGGAPQPRSPWIQDDEAFAERADPIAQGRAALLRYARHQASLIYANAWDHLITLARILGGDGAMPLFSQASVSRVICEAAVRFAWLMDPDISSAKRLVRGAVALHYSAEERSKGVRALPAEHFDPGYIAIPLCIRLDMDFACDGPPRHCAATRASESRHCPRRGDTRLPGQLDLKLGAVILDLEFHFQLDLIGDMRDEPQVPTFDDDIVVGGKLVSDRVQARSRRLPGERSLLLQLHEFHVSLRSSVETLSLRWAMF
jgi:hypothetical protein